jgi:hypothetical protein
MKQVIQRSIFLVLALLFLTNIKVEASHLRGGEITWKCVQSGGKSKYRFKVVVYTKCKSWCADCPQPFEVINVCNINGILSQTLNSSTFPASTTTFITTDGGINVRNIDRKDVSPDCSFDPATNTNGVHNPLECRRPNPATNSDEGALEKWTYESGEIDFTGVLPPTDVNTPTIFSLSMNARDGAVNLTPDVGNGSMYLVAKMYPFYPNGSTTAKPIQECFDNAPDFTESPAAILYTTGLDYVFNNNSVDIDLDNIYYELGTPYSDANGDCPYTRTPVEVWANYDYYNEQNPFGLLPSQYNFNNYTGEFTFKPLVSGNFVSVIKVSSYKCDQKVSEVYRDFKVQVLIPDSTENSNRYPLFFKPFLDAQNKPTNVLNVIAGKKLLIPIVVRDSLPRTILGGGISPQNLELTVNGIAMDDDNKDTSGVDAVCPYPPCAVLTREKGNYTYSISNPAPTPIQNIPGEIFGYGFDLGPAYSASSNDTVWLYWPTTCANLDKQDNCNGLTFSRYNFVVTAKDNFCRVPGKTIRTFTVNLLPPNFYLSPPIRCITYDQATHHVTFNWGVASGDTNTFIRYEIYRNNTLLTTEPNRNVYSYVDMSINASPDSTYYVRSINLCGVEDEVSPVKPITVEAFFYKNNQARLTWNPIRTPNNRTALGYNVYRSQTENPYNWVEVVDGDGDTTNTAAIDFVDLCGDTTYYKIEALDSLGCASISNIDTIFHQEISASFHSDTVCMGTPTQFVLDNLSGGIPPYSTVRWLGDEGFSAGNDDTVLYLYPTYGVKHFKFTVIDSKGCRIDIDDSTYVRQLPVFEIQKDSACPGAVINFGLDVKTPAGIDSVFWYGDFDAGTGEYLFKKEGKFSNLNIRSPKWIFGTNGGVGSFPILVMIRDTFGCETIMYDTVKTGEPTIELLNDPSLCYDTKKDSIHMLPKFLTKPFNTVQWIDNNNSQVLYQANDGKDAFPLSVVAGRRYIDLRVRIEDSKGCKGEVTQIYTLSPWIDFLPDSLCIGDVANLRTVHKPISDTANYRYLWELDANTVDTVRLPNHIYTSNGPKIITLLVTDIVTGCTTFIKDTLTVRDPMSFKVNVSPNCAGEETVFTRELYKAAIDTAWEWTIDESPNVIPNNTIFFKGNDTCRVMLPSSDGYFRVTLRINEQGTGCWTSFDTVMKVFNQPDIDFDVDSLNCAGKITQFVSKVVGNTPPYTYDWSGDDSFTDTSANPSHIYPENGEEYYLVSLSVTNGFGCVVTKTKNVRVCDDKKTMVQVPQIFSPGRERNNTLSVNYTNVDDFEFTVYNRWGIEVFKSIDPDFVWDGKDLSGEYLLTGTYVYIVKANGLGKRNYLNKGTIAILR